MERKLAELEPSEEQLSPLAVHESRQGSLLRVIKLQDPERALNELSETGLRDCVSGLGIGDAFSAIGRSSLLSPDEGA